MGLIDDIRGKRDSWMVRFEEHRKDEEDEYSSTDGDREREEEEILKNRGNVGVFPKKG